MGLFGLFSGMEGAKAAKDAANAQVSGYGNAQNVVTSTVGNAIPVLQGAADTGSRSLTENANNNAAGIGTVANAGAGSILAATGSGVGGIQTASSTAADRQNPYLTLGSTAANTLGQLTDPNANITALMQNLDPGYQFRLQQGQQALNNSASARGLSDSGAGLKAMDRYSQDYASNEYGNTFNRLGYLANMGTNAAATLNGQQIGAAVNSGQLGVSGTNSAAGMNLNASEFNSQLTQDAYKQAGAWGMTSADKINTDLMSGGLYNANALIGQGNAIAGGDVGRANSWGNFFNGMDKDMMTAFLLAGG